MNSPRSRNEGGFRLDARQKVGQAYVKELSEQLCSLMGILGTEFAFARNRLRIISLTLRARYSHYDSRRPFFAATGIFTLSHVVSSDVGKKISQSPHTCRIYTRVDRRMIGPL